jgi:AcrR family transcriptional regulator
VAVYRERGVGGATLKAIADRADVSRGTILHHFGDGEGLLAAVLAAATASLDVPDERVLEGHDDPEDRIRVYVDAMFRFYDRSSDWWTVFAGDRNEPPREPAFQAEEQRFWESMGRFQAAALGEAAADPAVAATLGTMVHPWVMNQLMAGGLSLVEVIDVVADLAIALVRRSGA